MDWQQVHAVLVFLQHCVSILGISIIIFGVFVAFVKYIYYLIAYGVYERGGKVNDIRLYLGRTLILGLEFIVAADLIGSTTTPDYYSVGLLAIIVLIRTLLNYSINREIMSLTRQNR